MYQRFAPTRQFGHARTHVLIVCPREYAARPSSLVVPNDHDTVLLLFRARSCMSYFCFLRVRGSEDTPVRVLGHAPSLFAAAVRGPRPPRVAVAVELQFRRPWPCRRVLNTAPKQPQPREAARKKVVVAVPKAAPPLHGARGILPAAMPKSREHWAVTQ